ncbi:hypothetical protein [Streptomyces termitum]|uniref:hypothetical protein n=1 Tax=Streptomyces termitum TaxID=67368 RepID=UPI0037BC8181
MGNSRAYAVHRTEDALEAYARARTLVALLATTDDTVHVDAEVRTVAEFRAVAALLPGASVDHPEVRRDPATGAYLECALDPATATDDEIRAELPLSLWKAVPPGTVEEAVVRAAPGGSTSVDWQGCWPDDPGTGAVGSPQYDGVQLVLHGDRAQIDGWTPHHTVFVHTSKWGDPARAERLAARIGSTVLDGPQIGW